MVAVLPSGKKIAWSIKGRDGYFETARMAVEAALTMAVSGPELRSGKYSVRGGVLTAGIACKDILFDRLLKSGMGFIDWSPGARPREPLSKRRSPFGLSFTTLETRASFPRGRTRARLRVVPQVRSGTSRNPTTARTTRSGA